MFSFAEARKLNIKLPALFAFAHVGLHQTAGAVAEELVMTVTIGHAGERERFIEKGLHQKQTEAAFCFPSLSSAVDHGGVHSEKCLCGTLSGAPHLSLRTIWRLQV